MEVIKLKEYWISEEKKVFQGWDFSYISKRKSEEPLPWNYNNIVKQYLKKGSTVGSCFKQLCILQSTVEKQGYIESEQHRFIIVSQKPNL